MMNNKNNSRKSSITISMFIKKLENIRQNKGDVFLSDVKMKYTKDNKSCIMDITYRPREESIVEKCSSIFLDIDDVE